jgi:uridine kinase
MPVNDVPVGFDRSAPAATTIEQVVEFLRPLAGPSARAPRMVLFGGCSRVGKTRLAEAVSARLESLGVTTRRVPLDAWLLGLDQRPPGSTVLDRYEGARIVEAVRALLDGRPVVPPVYDPATRRRTAPEAAEPLRLAAGMLMVDGVIALALPELRSLAAARIYVSAPDPARLERLRIFYRDVKGLGDEAESVIRAREVEEVPFIKLTRRWADLVFEARDQT